jgi:hypothetical protein
VRHRAVAANIQPTSMVRTLRFPYGLRTRNRTLLSLWKLGSSRA